MLKFTHLQNNNLHFLFLFYGKQSWFWVDVVCQIKKCIYESSKLFSSTFSNEYDNSGMTVSSLGSLCTSDGKKVLNT